MCIAEKKIIDMRKQFKYKSNQLLHFLMASLGSNTEKPTREQDGLTIADCLCNQFKLVYSQNLEQDRSIHKWIRDLKKHDDKLLTKQL